MLELLKDNDEWVIKNAITAAGKVKNERLVQPLLQFFLNRKYEKVVMDALHEAGDVSLKYIQQTLEHEKLSHQQQAKLILLCGRIGSEHATRILDDMVWKLPHLRHDIFHALHLCEFKSQPHHRKQHIELMNKYLSAATRILFMIRELQKQQNTQILRDALYIELDEIRASLLLLFSFVYNREKMMKAKSAFQLKNKESVANALEVLEIEVPKDISLKFIRLFEPGVLEDKCQALAVYFKEGMTYEKVVDEILADAHHHYHRWTKGAAIHSVNFYQGQSKKGWLEKAQKENDILLNETAGKILSEMD